MTQPNYSIAQLTLAAMISIGEFEQEFNDHLIKNKMLPGNFMYALFKRALIKRKCNKRLSHYVVTTNPVAAVYPEQNVIGFNEFMTKQFELNRRKYLTAWCWDRNVLTMVLSSKDNKSISHVRRKSGGAALSCGKTIFKDRCFKERMHIEDIQVQGNIFTLRFPLEPVMKPKPAA